MGKRGPPKKPSALRELEGNPGRLPINPDEPKPKLIETFEPPSDLSDEGKAIWVTLSKELSNIGLLTVIDLEPFYRYVKTLLEYRYADKQVGNKFVIPHRNEDGTIRYLQQNPWISIRNKAMAELNRLEQQFGMTPSARARMIGFTSGYGGKQKSEDEDPYAV